MDKGFWDANSLINDRGFILSKPVDQKPELKNNITSIF